MKPVVLAIVVQALWGLGRTAFRTRALAILGVFLPRLRRSPATAGFLDGINVGALAVMAAVTWFLSRAALVDVPTLLLGLVSVVLLIRFRPNPSWLILGGGVAGLLLR